MTKDICALHIVATGMGRPVVFVHGVGSDLESWDGVIETLGDGFRSIRFDLRGHGLSEKKLGPYTLDTFVDDLRHVLSALNEEKVDLVGFSLGGLIAQKFALVAPEFVRTLCLISTINDRTEVEQERVEKRANLLLTQGATAHLENAVDRWFSDDFRKNNPEVVEKRRQRSLQNHPACYAAAYQVLAHSDLGDEVRNINTPTLIMTGEHDIGSTPRMAEALHAKIRGSKLKILAGLKHSVLLEAPAEVGSALSDFYQSHV